MTGTDLCVNKPQSVPFIFEPPCNKASDIKLVSLYSTIRFTCLYSTDTPFGTKTSPGPKILK